MKRLYRSNRDRMVGGVCGGLATRYKIDPTWVRIIAVILLLVTGIVPFLLAYLIACIIIPPAPGGR